MTITARRMTATAIASGLAILLSGCSLLHQDTGPTRNAAGQITASATVDVTTLVAGDCFRSADKDFGTKPVTAVPCAKSHDFRVIQTGAATAAQIAKDVTGSNAEIVDRKGTGPKNQFDCAKAIAFFDRHGNHTALRRGEQGVREYVTELLSRM